MKTSLDKEELEILNAYKKKQLIVSETEQEDIENAVKSATWTIMQNSEIKIKISEKDVRNLKLKEIELGIPYQNIVSALIHKYLENKIKLTI